ncbi:MAG TPA: cation:proton antiporter, partial [Patescibacteria group bacterium]|nr:cation:proton antiporter [Patescibacteria group bacterium]
VIREVGKASLIAGLGQMLFTSDIGTALALQFHFSLVTSICLGIAFAFSSTIIVSKMLADKQDLARLYGKIAIGMLLVQDVIAVFLLIALSSWQTHVSLSSAFLLMILKGLFAIGVVFFIGFFLLPSLSKQFAASQEFLFLFAIGWGLGIAALFQGLGFTAEIGALVAGISLAASPYHYEISSKMKMLRDFFLVLFFVLLGAQLSFVSVAEIWKPALIFSAFILIADPLIVMILMGAMGYNKKTGFMTALTVTQISEFSLLFILFAIRINLLPDSMLTLVTLVGLITIGISAYLMRYAEGLYRFLAPALSLFERSDVKSERTKTERFDAVLFGYHRVGSDFLPSMQKLKQSYLVVDFDPDVIRNLEAKNIPCRYGDAEDDAFLDELHFSHLQMLVSTIPDFETNASLIDKLRKRNRKAVAIVIAHTVEEAMPLYDAGATYVIMPHFLGGNYASLLLQKFGLNAKKFEQERAQHMRHLLLKTKVNSPLAKAHQAEYS